MTVRELIAALEQIEDKNLEVDTEGCDCDGDVAKVEVRHGPQRPYVYLLRSVDD